MSNGTGLIVPIDVAAYCVGSIDAHEQTNGFAGGTTLYTNQFGDSGASLGVNVTRDLDEPPLWALEEGVHLHWAAPDGLTHASQVGTGDLNFPPLPNRWLVTRIAIQGEQVTNKAWIIESDTLSTDGPNGNNNAPTLPVQDTDQNFRYLGVWEVFDGTWVEPTIPPNQTIKTLFGSEIHAVASGDIAFAAFYPNARNVFGFYDDASDVSGNLMYVVTGWFSDPGNDPLTLTPPVFPPPPPPPPTLAEWTLAELQTQYSWTYAQSNGLIPSHSLYSGLIQDIQWNLNTRYITDSQEPISLDVAVGNYPAETLAAYFRGLNNPSLPIFEQLFTMFEMGLLSSFKQAQPGQMADLAETLHDTQFNGQNAGTVYTIVTKPVAQPDSLADQNIAPNLPLPLADALNLLNEYQQQSDLAVVEMQQYRWQMFVDWYRMFQVDSTLQGAAFTTFTNHLQFWQSIQQNSSQADIQCQQQLTVVNQMLTGDLILKAVPAAQFCVANEPVILVAGQNIEPARRYGGDGDYNADGYLVCRLTTQVISQVELNTGSVTTLNASQFSSALPTNVSQLPYGADHSNLIEEACLLNTSLAAALANSTDETLEGALAAWLEGTQQSGNPYQQFTGTLVSPVAVQWWSGPNPSFPLMLLWDADFYPLMPTVSGAALQNYPAQIFTANYTVDPNNEGLIGYTPGTEPGGVTIDPKTIDFNPEDPQSVIQQFSGASVLSTTPADNLEALLTSYPGLNQDSTLTAILAQLKDTNILMQAMSGFNNALLMRDQSLQLNISVGPQAHGPFKSATTQVTNIIGDISNIPALVPNFNGSFNPFRAGYMQLSLRIMDAFGQKRPVTINNLYLADSVTTYYQQQTEPGIIYLQPRLSQPSRLLCRFLAADTTEYDEMNSHPATSPICGWLLTNHLSGGFFFYNQQGKPLGSLTVKGDSSGIEWQATPGDDNTINEDLATVMQYENPQLVGLAAALNGASVDFFNAFWTAVDSASTYITLPTPSTASGMAALVGQPIALVQISLLLQLQGMGVTNLSLNTISSDQSDFQDTDNQLSEVQFPVILGDLKEIDDGLVGYFMEGQGGTYNFANFYSQAATGQGSSGVVQPSPDNLLLTPASTPEGQPPSVTQGEQKVLVLMDPRAGIHATTGILPTQYLEVPSYQYADTLRTLEMTFLTTPVLKPSTGLALPVPAESGYTWSWIEEVPVNGGGSEWLVTPDIAAPTANAVWQYTPQSITEGWLRLNPRILTFTLVNSLGAPVVNAGAANDLTLTITNLRQASITFEPGVLANEGTPAQGSVFYIHFGALVDSTLVSAIQLSATGWTFQSLTDAQYGTYWAATPATGNPITLAPGASQQISVTQLQAVKTGIQAQVYFDYYDVQGDNDGVDVAVITLQSDS